MHGRFLIVAGFLTALLAHCAWCQPTNPANASEERLVRHEPDILYVVDDAGQPIPVANLSLEEFRRMYDLAKGLERSNLPPAFHVTEMKLNVEADGDRAQVNATVKVRLLRSGSHTVSIGMRELQLTELPEINEVQRVVAASFNEQHGEYELIVEGEKQEILEVQVRGIASIRSVGRESRLQITLPRATVSTCEVQVPTVGIQYDCQSALDIETTTEETHTVFLATGLQPNFEFSWRPVEQTTDEDAPPVEVNTVVDTRIGRTSVTSDVRLTVSGIQQPVERLALRLPPNAELLESDRGGYRVRTIGEEDGRDRLELMFEDPELNPVIHLRVENFSGLDQAETSEALPLLALDAYDVSGAVRHSGTVRTRAIPGWKLEWQLGDFARRVNNPDAARGVSTFDFAQPDQVTVHLSSRKSELSVLPTYVVQMQESELLVTAYFRCRVRGARPENLRVDVGEDWTLEIPDVSANEDGYIRPDLDIQMEGGQAQIPLIQAASNDFIVKINLSRPQMVFAEAAPILIDFPVPQGVQSLRQATVVVLRAPRVYVATDEEHTGPYTVIAEDPTIAKLLPRDAMTPLYFRHRSPGRPAPLELVAHTLERRTSIDCVAEITKVSGGLIHVRQTMHWRIHNVPLAKTLLTFDSIVSQDSLQVTVNGEPVIPTQMSSAFGTLVNRESSEVELPAVAGSFEMVVDYAAELEPLGMDAVHRVNLSLVIPKENLTSELVDNWNLYFKQPNLPDYEASLLETTDWATSEAFVDDNSGDSWLATTDELVRNIPLAIRPRDTSIETNHFGAIVERAWFQTWYTKSSRQDRAVFRITGSNDRLRVSLPRSENIEQLYVWVDGQLVPQDGLELGSLELELAPGRNYHTLEIIYSSTNREPPGKLATIVPQVVQADMLGQWMWHVVIPRSECLLTAHDSLTPAHRWSWASWLPRAQSQLSQSQLEAWIGAMRLERKKLWGSNELLFSGVGPVEELSISTSNLSIYTLATVGSVLVVGLLLVYVKKSQRLMLIAIVGTALFVVVMINPRVAAIAGQTAAFGISLVATATVLAYQHRQAVKRGMVSERGAIKVMESGPEADSAVPEGTTQFAMDSGEFSTD